MQLTIDVPEKVVERAATLGLPVSTLISRALEQIAEEPMPEGFVGLGVSTLTRAEAAAALLEIQRNHTLEGLKVKDLIEDGRRC